MNKPTIQFSDAETSANPLGLNYDAVKGQDLLSFSGVAITAKPVVAVALNTLGQVAKRINDNRAEQGYDMKVSKLGKSDILVGLFDESNEEIVLHEEELYKFASSLRSLLKKNGMEVTGFVSLAMATNGFQTACQDIARRGLAKNHYGKATIANIWEEEQVKAKKEQEA